MRLDYDGPSVRVTVADTGSGFDVEAATGGFGLRGMRNRAASIGGHCTVASDAATGSRRRREVLRLVADGTSNVDIGVRLRISQATVKTHLLRAYQKLGVNDRTAAMTTAIRRGLLRL